MRCILAVAVGLLLAGAACSSDKAGATTVVATDTKCTPDKTEFGAGQHTFEIKNEGKKVTELYVYAEGDQIVSEVENVGPGTSRQLTADLRAGTYELACKPGQTGKGIRVSITVTGSGGSQGAPHPVDREVAVEDLDFAFKGVDNFSAKADETGIAGHEEQGMKGTFKVTEA
jgi:iron uptake system component EfeO